VGEDGTSHRPAPAPAFVESYLGLFNGSPGEMNLGALVPVYNLAGILFILGGLLLGIATVRARVLPRWSAGLLTIAAALIPAASLLSHPLNRIVAVPMGLAFIWLGYAPWSEGRKKAVAPSPDAGSPQLGRAGAD